MVYAALRPLSGLTSRAMRRTAVAKAHCHRWYIGPCFAASWRAFSAEYATAHG